MQLRPRASSVIVHEIAAGDAERFLAWQRDITASASELPGYQDTDVYPPTEPGGRQWVIVVHFDDAARLAAWSASSARAEHIERFAREFRGESFQVKNLDKGFGHYFTQSAPPAWKMMITVLLGLYPTVVLLSVVTKPLAGLGFAFSLLIGNALSVCLLEWVVMPALVRTLKPWHSARSPQVTAFGLAAVLGALALLALSFHRWLG
jgi:antibiotic biosynthesis monooxygenase (ABM) superfamily enzyme